MNNWLGFSLSPGIDGGGVSRDEEDGSDMRLCYESFGEDERLMLPALPVMPLRSDGSLCMSEAFRRSDEDWKYDNAMSNPSNACGEQDKERPKLEDFLGCYSTAVVDNAGTAVGDGGAAAATAAAQTQQQAYYYSSLYSHHAVPYDHQRINVNVVPVFPGADEQDEPSFQHSFTDQSCYPAPSHFQSANGLHPIAVDHGPPSISDFKSWLRQNPVERAAGEVDRCTRMQGLSLSMRPAMTTNLNPAPVVDSAVVATTSATPDQGRKKAGGKLSLREPVPRKSLDTFGQRTSQYRGVTRSVTCFHCGIYLCYIIMTYDESNHLILVVLIEYSMG